MPREDKHICPYCKRKFKGYGNNPEEYGMHDFEDWSKVGSVCPKCDAAVTQTNRILQDIVMTNGNSRSLQNLKNHVDRIIDMYQSKEELF